MMASEAEKPGPGRTGTVPRIAGAGQLAMRVRVLRELLALGADLAVFIIGFTFPPSRQRSHGQTME
jgi:hypothetical protein